MTIIDHTHPRYIEMWNAQGVDRWNGAYYYSREIVRNIIPNVETDRNWVTINIPGEACDHSVVFVHNNLYPQLYGWLREYRDVVMVCGVPSTCRKVAYACDAFCYLPLSIDVEEIMAYQRSKDRDVCFVGRIAKHEGLDIPKGTVHLSAMPREELLPELARYRRAYAVGRCALEAKALGCEVLPYDPRFPDPDVWRVMDNREAAAILQGQLDFIDGRG